MDEVLIKMWIFNKTLQLEVEMLREQLRKDSVITYVSRDLATTESLVATRTYH